MLLLLDAGWLADWRWWWWCGQREHTQRKNMCRATRTLCDRTRFAYLFLLCRPFIFGWICFVFRVASFFLSPSLSLCRSAFFVLLLVFRHFAVRCMFCWIHTTHSCIKLCFVFILTLLFNAFVWKLAFSVGWTFVSLIFSNFIFVFFLLFRAVRMFSFVHMSVFMGSEIVHGVENTSFELHFSFVQTL